MDEKKNKYIIFLATRKMVASKLYLKINNAPLLPTDSYEYLGIALDYWLTFERQINRLLAFCNQRLFTLSKIKTRY